MAPQTLIPALPGTIPNPHPHPSSSSSSRPSLSSKVTSSSSASSGIPAPSTFHQSRSPFASSPSSTTTSLSKATVTTTKSSNLRSNSIPVGNGNRKGKESTGGRGGLKGLFHKKSSKSEVSSPSTSSSHLPHTPIHAYGQNHNHGESKSAQTILDSNVSGTLLVNKGGSGGMGGGGVGWKGKMKAKEKKLEVDTKMNRMGGGGGFGFHSNNNKGGHGKLSPISPPPITSSSGKSPISPSNYLASSPSSITSVLTTSSTSASAASSSFSLASSASIGMKTSTTGFTIPTPVPLTGTGSGSTFEEQQKKGLTQAQYPPFHYQTLSNNPMALKTLPPGKHPYQSPQGYQPPSSSPASHPPSSFSRIAMGGGSLGSNSGRSRSGSHGVAGGGDPNVRSNTLPLPSPSFSISNASPIPNPTPSPTGLTIPLTAPDERGFYPPGRYPTLMQKKPVANSNGYFDFEGSRKGETGFGGRDSHAGDGEGGGGETESPERGKHHLLQAGKKGYPSQFHSFPQQPPSDGFGSGHSPRPPYYHVNSRSSHHHHSPSAPTLLSNTSSPHNHDEHAFVVEPSIFEEEQPPDFHLSGSSFSPTPASALKALKSPASPSTLPSTPVGKSTRDMQKGKGKGKRHISSPSLDSRLQELSKGRNNANIGYGSRDGVGEFGNWRGDGQEDLTVKAPGPSDPLKSNLDFESLGRRGEFDSLDIIHPNARIDSVDQEPTGKKPVPIGNSKRGLPQLHSQPQSQSGSAAPTPIPSPHPTRNQHQQKTMNGSDSRAPPNTLQASALGADDPFFKFRHRILRPLAATTTTSNSKSRSDDEGAHHDRNEGSSLSTPTPPPTKSSPTSPSLPLRDISTNATLLPPNSPSYSSHHLSVSSSTSQPLSPISQRRRERQPSATSDCSSFYSPQPDGDSEGGRFSGNNREESPLLNERFSPPDSIASQPRPSFQMNEKNDPDYSSYYWNSQEDLRSVSPLRTPHISNVAAVDDMVINTIREEEGERERIENDSNHGGGTPKSTSSVLSSSLIDYYQRFSEEYGNKPSEGDRKGKREDPNHSVLWDELERELGMKEQKEDETRQSPEFWLDRIEKESDPEYDKSMEGTVLIQDKDCTLKEVRFRGNLYQDRRAKWDDEGKGKDEDEEALKKFLSGALATAAPRLASTSPPSPPFSTLRQLNDCNGSDDFLPSSMSSFEIPSIPTSAPRPQNTSQPHQTDQDSRSTIQPTSKPISILAWECIDMRRRSETLSHSRRPLFLGGPQNKTPNTREQASDVQSCSSDGENHAHERATQISERSRHQKSQSHGGRLSHMPSVESMNQSSSGNGDTSNANLMKKIDPNLAAESFPTSTPSPLIRSLRFWAPELPEAIETPDSPHTNDEEGALSGRAKTILSIKRSTNSTEPESKNNDNDKGHSTDPPVDRRPVAPHRPGSSEASSSSKVPTQQRTNEDLTMADLMLRVPSPSSAARTGTSITPSTGGSSATSSNLYSGPASSRSVSSCGESEKSSTLWSSVTSATSTSSLDDKLFGLDVAPDSSTGSGSGLPKQKKSQKQFRPDWDGYISALDIVSCGTDEGDNEGYETQDSTDKEMEMRFDSVSSKGKGKERPASGSLLALSSSLSVAKSSSPARQRSGTTRSALPSSSKSSTKVPPRLESLKHLRPSSKPMPKASSSSLTSTSTATTTPSKFPSAPGSFGGESQARTNGIKNNASSIPRDSPSPSQTEFGVLSTQQESSQKPSSTTTTMPRGASLRPRIPSFSELASSPSFISTSSRAKTKFSSIPSPSPSPTAFLSANISPLPSRCPSPGSRTPSPAPGPNPSTTPIVSSSNASASVAESFASIPSRKANPTITPPITSSASRSKITQSPQASSQSSLPTPRGRASTTSNDSVRPPTIGRPRTKTSVVTEGLKSHASPSGLSSPFRTANTSTPRPRRPTKQPSTDTSGDNDPNITPNRPPPTAYSPISTVRRPREGSISSPTGGLTPAGLPVPGGSGLQQGRKLSITSIGSSGSGGSRLPVRGAVGKTPGRR